eukprot:scaffold43234_cov31-Tisochrysis_lutea.AAC.1
MMAEPGPSRATLAPQPAKSARKPSSIRMVRRQAIVLAFGRPAVPAAFCKAAACCRVFTTSKGLFTVPAATPAVKPATVAPKPAYSAASPSVCQSLVAIARAPSATWSALAVCICTLTVSSGVISTASHAPAIAPDTKHLVSGFNIPPAASIAPNLSLAANLKPLRGTTIARPGPKPLHRAGKPPSPSAAPSAPRRPPQGAEAPCSLVFARSRGWRRLSSAVAATAAERKEAEMGGTIWGLISHVSDENEVGGVRKGGRERAESGVGGSSLRRRRQSARRRTQRIDRLGVNVHTDESSSAPFLNPTVRPTSDRDETRVLLLRFYK